MLNASQIHQISYLFPLPHFMNSDLLKLRHDLVDGLFQVFGNVLHMFVVASAVVDLGLFSGVLLVVSSNHFLPLPFSLEHTLNVFDDAVLVCSAPLQAGFASF